MLVKALLLKEEKMFVNIYFFRGYYKSVFSKQVIAKRLWTEMTKWTLQRVKQTLTKLWLVCSLKFTFKIKKKNRILELDLWLLLLGNYLCQWLLLCRWTFSTIDVWCPFIVDNTRERNSWTWLIMLRSKFCWSSLLEGIYLNYPIKWTAALNSLLFNG